MMTTVTQTTPLVATTQQSDVSWPKQKNEEANPSNKRGLDWTPLTKVQILPAMTTPKGMGSFQRTEIVPWETLKKGLASVRLTWFKPELQKAVKRWRINWSSRRNCRDHWRKNPARKLKLPTTLCIQERKNLLTKCVRLLFGDKALNTNLGRVRICLTYWRSCPLSAGWGTSLDFKIRLTFGGDTASDIKRLLASILGIAAMEEILQKAGLIRHVGTTVNDPELFSAHRGRSIQTQTKWSDPLCWLKYSRGCRCECVAS